MWWPFTQIWPFPISSSFLLVYAIEPSVRHSLLSAKSSLPSFFFHSGPRSFFSFRVVCSSLRKLLHTAPLRLSNSSFPVLV
uniref:Uncharacterized protein n=1 Tax=Arundo donax TaxID=35708 RepID=A0A0A9FHD4_ARUDO